MSDARATRTRGNSATLTHKFMPLLALLFCGCFTIPDAPQPPADDDVGDDDSGDDDVGDDDTGDDDTDPVDGDGDGYDETVDCDDTNPDVNPGATEVCNGIDDDCDGTADNPDQVEYFDLCLDSDGDGYGDPDATERYCAPFGQHIVDCTDCDDADASIHPNATEVACDVLDNDCDQVQHPEDVDDDGDGWTECEGDCDDTNPTIHPGATEICNNLDDDCDGVIDDDPASVDWYPDADGDGHGDPAGPVVVACEPHPGHSQLADDCDDNDATVYGGAPELCDGLDNDCDGSLSGDETDDDGDGVTECDIPPDCDDTNATVYPGATDICDGLDNDCDGAPTAAETDDDGDSYDECGVGGQPQDCDDADPTVHPGATETCNGVDDDCDGTVDNDVVAQDWYPDADHDGYGDPDATPVNDCIPPAGYVADHTDCDDAAYLVNPGMAELPCDGVDNDCDGLHHENDADGDLDGYTECDGDCDDTNPDTYPGAPEICDGEDNDCLGGVPADERDDDGDGFEECGIGGADPDCDDTQPTVYPGAPEICDSLDNDCDGSLGVDEVDVDGDGWTVCGGDCDDADATIHPGADEGCNGLDNDCDGAPGPDEVDADGDGWMVCEGDCDDTNPDTYPGAAELCDGEDNDCDGTVPANENDNDSDGYRVCDGDCDDNDPNTYPGATEICDGVLDNSCDNNDDPDEIDNDGDGYTECDGDCDDSEPTMNPGQSEMCDGLDNDCSGTVPIDENDDDGDGWVECSPWVGNDPTVSGGGDCDDGDATMNWDDADSDTWATCNGDCDDGDATVNPGETEICDAIDHDCDGDPLNECSTCGALQLDNVDDAIRIEDAAVFDGMNLFTAELWFNPWQDLDATHERENFLLDADTNTTIWNLNYGDYAGELRFVVWTNAGMNIAIYNTTFDAGTWYHLAAVWDGTTALLFVDGQLVASDSSNPGQMMGNNQGPTIGTAYDPPLCFECGALAATVDEIRISTVARYTGAPFTPETYFTVDPDTALLLHLEDGQGDPVDSSSYAHNIWFTSSPLWVQDCITTGCGALELDGQDDAIGVGPTTAFGNIPAMTVELWMKPTVDLIPGVGRAEILYLEEQPGGAAWLMNYDEASGAIRIGVDTVPQQNAVLDHSTTFLANNWYHLAFTFDGNDLDLFIDGEHVATDSSGSGDVEASNGELGIGYRPWDQSYYLPAVVDEVRVSDVTRYTPAGAPFAPETRFVDDANTLLLLHLDEGQGIPADSSSFGHSISFVDAPTWVEECITTGCDALELDGQDDAILVEGSPTFDALPEMTAEMWFMPTVDLDSSYGRVEFFYEEQQANSGVWGMSYDDYDGKLACNINVGPGSNSAQFATEFPAGVWHHVACTWDGTSADMFLDGEHVATDASFVGSMVTTAYEPLHIGRKPYIWSGDPGGNFLPAVIGEVRVSEVVRYTLAGAPYSLPTTLPNDADTLALLHFDSGMGLPVDSSAHGHTTSVEDSPTWVEECISISSLSTWPLTITETTSFAYHTGDDYFGAIDADGDDIYLIWAAEGGSCCWCPNVTIWYSESHDGGASFSSPSVIASGGDGYQYSSARLSGPNILTSYGDASVGVCDSFKPRISMSDNDGSSWSPVGSYDPVPGSGSGPGAVGSAQNCATAAASPYAYSACSINYATDTLGLYLATSDDDGLTWSTMDPIGLVVDTRGGRGFNMEAEGDSLYLAWADEQDGDYEIHFARTDDEGGSWNDHTTLTSNSHEDSFPAISAHGDSVAIVWREADTSFYNAWIAFSDDRGATWTTPVQFGPTDEVTYMDVEFFDATTAYAMYCHRDVQSDDYCFVSRTSDEGQTWEPWIDFVQGLTYDSVLGQGDRMLVVDDQEIVHIVWSDRVGGCCSAGDRYYTRLE